MSRPVYVSSYGTLNNVTFQQLMAQGLGKLDQAQGDVHAGWVDNGSCMAGAGQPRRSGGHANGGEPRMFHFGGSGVCGIGLWEATFRKPAIGNVVVE